MMDWARIVVPAVAIALVIRIDAIRIGPYFALSTLISATEGYDASFWYENSQRRTALIRRFLYPCAAGFGLGWAGFDWTDVASVGFLAAGLLIWPAIVGGLPWFVPRRSWHLPTLYLTFVVASALAACAGLALQVAIANYSDGDFRSWAVEQAVTNGAIWLAAIFVGSLFKATFRRTNDLARARERDVNEPY